MNKEKNYLIAIEGKFKGFAQLVLEMDGQDLELLNKLYALIKEAVEFEKKCREENNVGVRFSVIVNQLNELEQICQQEIILLTGEYSSKVNKNYGDNIAADEMPIFIYLFNSQGANIKTWRPQLTFKALIDHSINRPIYTNKQYVDELIRGKENSAQHAYVRAILKKSDILMSEEESILKDKQGHPIIRIKQGALKPHSILEFYHNDKVYVRLDNDSYELQQSQDEIS